MNRFQIGSQVIRRATGMSGTVVAVDGVMCEVVFQDVGRIGVHYQDLDADTTDPISSLLQGRLANAIEYGLRLQARYLENAYRFDPISGLSSARVELLPHQVFLAHRIGRKPRARMILSDEVGLGKTIEAGLVLKEQIARGLAERALVICPASLQLQWKNELKSKFNEEFTIIDGDSARHLERNGQNPWSKYDKVITSIHLARREDRAIQITEASWDFLIVDEAHHARRSLEGSDRVRSTLAYELVDELKEGVNGLLLLSATPMQLHQFELYSMIELVEPGLYPSFEDYERRRTTLPRLNDLMRDLQQWEALSAETRGAAFNRNRKLLGELGVASIDQLDVQKSRENAIDMLTEHHPLSMVLVRNRKAVIGGFKKRAASRVPVHLTPEEISVYEAVSDYIHHYYNLAKGQKNNAIGFLMVLYQKMLASSSTALRSSLKNRVSKLKAMSLPEKGLSAKAKRLSDEDIEDLREKWEADDAQQLLDFVHLADADNDREIAILEDLIIRLGRIRDTKAKILVEQIIRPVLAHDPADKFLIFTTFKETQTLLVSCLRQFGVPACTFHGGMSLEEKEASVQRFRDDIPVLISTEAGGEGRNFQFARNLVNYDLPWNPMVVEQRIGRLDRIGQKRDVRIFNLSCVGTVEDRVLKVLDERIGLFEESVGSLDPILGNVEEDLERMIMTHTDTLDEDLEEYGERLEQNIRLAREAEKKWGDFVLDRASFRSDEAQRILSKQPLARWSDLKDFVASALDYYGGRLSEHSEGGDSLTLSPVLQQKLRVSDRVNRGVFDPKLALRLEELDFFAVGHPAVDSLMGFVSANGATAAARRLASAPRGTSVEVVYQVESNGLRPYGEMVRHLVTEDLTVFEEVLSSFPEPGVPVTVEVPAWTGAALEASARALLNTLETFRARAQQEHEEHRRSAIEREERLHAYKKTFLVGFISEKEEWIQEVEKHGSKNRRRILPAIRGKIRKYKEKLETLDDDYNARLERIRSQRVDVSRTIVVAGLVVQE